MYSITSTLAAALCLSVEVVATPLSKSLKARAGSVIVGWEYSSCYTEATGQRALTASTFLNDLKCATHCAVSLYFGVEFGQECYCGPSLNAGINPVDEGDCNFPCPGDNIETCGAGDRLSVYKQTLLASPTTSTMATATPFPTSYQSQGCYSEATNGRALVSKYVTSNTQTIDTCAKACAGFTFFGLEYHFECFCGNELQAGSLLVDATECNLPCNGDNSETCGGNSKLSLYSFGGVVPPVSSSTSSVVVTPTPTTYSGYELHGCYTDSTDTRTLNRASYADDAMTVELCASTCSGFELFGVEYGRECMCGNSLVSSTKVGIEECSMNCAGNPSEKCGAGDRLNVYHYGPDSSLPTSSSSTEASSTSISSSTLSTITTTSTTTSEVSTSSSTTTTTSTVPSVPTDFCLTASIGTANYVVGNYYAGLNIQTKPVGTLTPATLKMSITSEGRLITPANGYMAYTPDPFLSSQVVRFDDYWQEDYALLTCSGTFGEELKCIAPHGPVYNGPPGTYISFYRYHEFGTILMVERPMENEIYGVPISLIITADCPA